MGKKGGSKHIKRLPAPAFWPVHVKESKWVVKPRAGPHPMARSIPLAIVLSKILNYAKTTKEAKTTIAKGAVKVDGKINRDYKYPVGLMDLIEIPDAKSTFRMVPFPGKGLSLLKVAKDETGYKLSLLSNKISLHGGKIQLNFSDGRNITTTKEATSAGETYAPGDTVQIGIPEQKILGHIKFAEGKYALVVAGKNIGRHGKIVGVEKSKASRFPTVTVQDAQGQTFRTIADYVFAIGNDKPIIKLPGE